MPRKRLTSEQLLKRIESEQRSHAAAVAADRLLRLGDSVGAQRIGRQASISVRLPGPEIRKSWLTLFLIQASGDFTVWYTYLWKEIGVSQAVVDRYGRRMRRLFGPDVEESGVPVTAIVKQWSAFAPIIREAADSINAHVRTFGPRTRDADGSRALSALEGIVTEARVYRYSRSRTLRNEALSKSTGTCACCRVAFAELLGGRGARVLQVHHKEQLSVRDRPKRTKLSDLVVVCANCHLLIHADPETAMRVEAVRALWKRYRRAARHS